MDLLSMELPRTNDPRIQRDDCVLFVSLEYKNELELHYLDPHILNRAHMYYITCKEQLRASQHGVDSDTLTSWSLSSFGHKKFMCVWKGG